MINIKTNEEKLKEQLLLIVKLFIDKNKLDETDMFIEHEYEINDSILFSRVSVLFKKKQIKFENTLLIPNNTNKSHYHFIEMQAKILCYKCCVKIFKQKMPWGALTGIRPSKLYSDKVNESGSIKNANSIMKNVYLVSKKRIEILNKIYFAQKQVLTDICDKYVDFYVNIPFCTSRCYYCSFLSATIDKCKDLLEPYVDALIYEVKQSLSFIKKSGYIIKNIYFGGGTPTALPLNLLEKIIKLMPNVEEFTIEAGRPDTISEETFKLFKKYGVTRISINPQTFNNKTLKRIGRNHSAEECVEIYNLARNYNFIINMDLIAGLDGESFKDFRYSLKKALALQPDNLTVHTLCFKRTSSLNLVGGETASDAETQKMVNYSIGKIIKNNYMPYYLYKQKNTIANLENIGYCKNKTACLFNINSMEECSSIIACGANGISKRLYSKTNRIERFANVKNIQEYINRIDEMIRKKIDLFSDN